MHNSIRHNSVGATLQSARESLGLSYRDMAEITKIQPAYLEYLENGRFDELPAEVYVRGFLRSYARELRLSEDEIISSYLNETGQHLAVTTPSEVEDNELGDRDRLAHFARENSFRRYFVAGGLMAAAILAAFVMLVVGGENEADDQASASFRMQDSAQTWQPPVENSNEWRQ